MRITLVVSTFLTGALLASSAVEAATQWDANDYTLYSGDFANDGRTGVLYIAKSPSNPSGIARSNPDGSGPNMPLQSWASNYLGIPWSSNQYKVIVADFNGDHCADIFLQSIVPGDNYLLLTSCTGTTKGQVLAISQTIHNNAMGLVWSADQHAIIAGDFNGDGKADLFLQMASPAAVNAIVLADPNGQFTSTAPAQTWPEFFLGFHWSTARAIVYAANFNAGDTRADLLVQARPLFVEIPYDPAFVVPSYLPAMNGIAFSESSTAPIFASSGSVSPATQPWSRFSNGIDWSPLTSTLIVGDYSGDGRADILVQAKTSTQTTYLLTANSSGAPYPASPTTVFSNVPLSKDSAVLIAGNFAGTAAGIYVQAPSASGTNYVIDSVGSTATASAADSSQSYAYVYDALGRVTTVTYSKGFSGYTTSYGYDAAGNRTSRVTVVN